MELNAHERAQLAGILGCTPDQVDEQLKAYSEAATEEYVRMILGQRVFTRGQDIREYRLLLLILRAFGGSLPTEQRISDLFQTTTSQSRALLRAVMSKYQYELQSSIDVTLRDVLDAAEQDVETKVWRVTVDSQNVIDTLNRRLAAIGGTLPQIVRARNMITTYEIANSTYQTLIKR